MSLKKSTKVAFQLVWNTPRSSKASGFLDSMNGVAYKSFLFVPVLMSTNTVVREKDTGPQHEAGDLLLTLSLQLPITKLLESLWDFENPQT